MLNGWVSRAATPQGQVRRTALLRIGGLLAVIPGTCLPDTPEGVSKIIRVTSAIAAAAPLGVCRGVGLMGDGS